MTRWLKSEWPIPVGWVVAVGAVLYAAWSCGT